MSLYHRGILKLEIDKACQLAINEHCILKDDKLKGRKLLSKTILQPTSKIIYCAIHQREKVFTYELFIVQGRKFSHFLIVEIHGKGMLYIYIFNYL